MKNVLFALLVTASTVLTACGGGESTSDNSTDTAKSDPEKMYMQKCSNCHGADLTGGAGPALNQIGTTHSKEDIEKIINEGQKMMPKGLLEGEDASKVAEWLAEKK